MKDLWGAGCECAPQLTIALLWRSLAPWPLLRLLAGQLDALSGDVTRAWGAVVVPMGRQWRLGGIFRLRSARQSAPPY